MKDNWQNKIDELKKEIIKQNEETISFADYGAVICNIDRSRLIAKLTQLQEDKTLHEQEISECERVWVAKYRQAKEEINQLRNENEQELKAFAEEIKKKFKIEFEKVDSLDSINLWFKKLIDKLLQEKLK
jgi:chromosome segregation ATPase